MDGCAGAALPVCEGGKVLMMEAIGWGLGVAAAIIVVHFLLSATPGVNKFLRIGPCTRKRG